MLLTHPSLLIFLGHVTRISSEAGSRSISFSVPRQSWYIMALLVRSGPDSLLCGKILYKSSRGIKWPRVHIYVRTGKYVSTCNVCCKNIEHFKDFQTKKEKSSWNVMSKLPISVNVLQTFTLPYFHLFKICLLCCSLSWSWNPITSPCSANHGPPKTVDSSLLSAQS